MPADAVPVADDAALAALVAPALEAGRRPVTAVLLGGDLHRTLGGVEGRSVRPDDALLVDLDAVEVLLGGRRRWAVAHVLAQGRRGWTAPSYVAMNAAFRGSLQLGPRAHPGDGLLDVTEGRIRRRERREGRRRMQAGTHLPHDGLRTRRVAHDHVVLPRPIPVLLDGVRVGRFSDLEVRAHPDALTVVV